MDKYTMGFKFRIYPNHAQQELINRTLGCCRFVFNHFLAIRRDEWTANHKSVTYNQTSAMLTDLKKYEEYSWLKEVDSMALQESLKNFKSVDSKSFFTGKNISAARRRADGIFERGDDIQGS